MKIYGYPEQDRPIEEIASIPLGEITLVASPDELRRIATFLHSCATGMETRGGSWGHEHLADKDRYFEHSPHFVVFNPDHGK